MDIDELRRAFVAGARWWEYHSTKATMWQSDQRIAEVEAEKRYGENPPRCNNNYILNSIHHKELTKKS